MRPSFLCISSDSQKLVSDNDIHFLDKIGLHGFVWYIDYAHNAKSNIKTQLPT